MVKLLAPLFALLFSTSAFAADPCIWSGAYVKCLPSSGIKLENSQSLLVTGMGRIAGPSLVMINGTTAQEISLTPSAAGGSNIDLFLPSALGASGSVLTDALGNGHLTWAVPAAGGTAIGDAIAGGTAGSVLFVDGSGDLGQNNANFHWDPTTARLGVGTTAPGGRLDVEGGSLIVGDTSPPAGSASSIVGTASFSASSGAWNSAASWLEISHDSNGASILEGSAAKNIRLYSKDAGGIQRGPLMLDQNGKVGIGTTAPTQALDVVGKIHTSDDVIQETIGFGQQVSLHGGSQLIGSADLYLDTASSGAIHFRPGFSEKMTVLNGGNVGIGTTNPGSKLEVVGDITASTAGLVKIKANGVVHFANMTTAARNALTGVQAGDQIYNTDTGALEFYDGAAWN